MHPIRVKLKKPEYKSCHLFKFYSFQVHFKRKCQSDKRISTKRRIFGYPTCPISMKNIFAPFKHFFPNLLIYYKWFLHPPWAHATWGSLKFSKKTKLIHPTVQYLETILPKKLRLFNLNKIPIRQIVMHWCFSERILKKKIGRNMRFLCAN